jgi:hypothetical protein
MLPPHAVALLLLLLLPATAAAAVAAVLLLLLLAACCMSAFSWAQCWTAYSSIGSSCTHCMCVALLQDIRFWDQAWDGSDPKAIPVPPVRPCSSARLSRRTRRNARCCPGVQDCDRPNAA